MKLKKKKKSENAISRHLYTHDIFTVFVSLSPFTSYIYIYSTTIKTHNLLINSLGNKNIARYLHLFFIIFISRQREEDKKAKKLWIIVTLLSLNSATFLLERCALSLVSLNIAWIKSIEIIALEIKNGSVDFF